MTPYEKALARDDLSQWLVHFTKADFNTVPPRPAFDVLRNIVGTAHLHASFRPEIARMDARGASCFYEVPIAQWKKLIETNPNGRELVGIIVNKRAFWNAGGRPAIYAGSITPTDWPQHERFRLITTDFTRETPIDWTHEREWRFAGHLNLNYIHYWACVPTIKECQLLFNEFPFLTQGIFVHECHRTIMPHEFLAIR